MGVPDRHRSGRLRHTGNRRPPMGTGPTIQAPVSPMRRSSRPRNRQTRWCRSSAGNDSSKSIQDRLGERAANERVVGAPRGTRCVAGSLYHIAGLRTSSAIRTFCSIESLGRRPSPSTDPKPVRTVPISGPRASDPMRPGERRRGRRCKPYLHHRVAATRPIGATRPRKTGPAPAQRRGSDLARPARTGERNGTSSVYQAPRPVPPRHPRQQPAPASAPRLASATATRHRKPAAAIVVQNLLAA